MRDDIKLEAVGKQAWIVTPLSKERPEEMRFKKRRLRGSQRRKKEEQRERKGLEGRKRGEKQGGRRAERRGEMMSGEKREEKMKQTL